MKERNKIQMNFINNEFLKMKISNDITPATNQSEDESILIMNDAQKEGTPFILKTAKQIKDHVAKKGNVFM